MLKKKIFEWDNFLWNSILASAKDFSYSFHLEWMSLMFHNSETKAQIKKLKTCGPPPLVIVSGETNIALIWKAVLARQYLLYQTNYKNIILEIKRCIWLSWHFDFDMIRKSDLAFLATSEIVITAIKSYISHIDWSNIKECIWQADTLIFKSWHDQNIWPRFLCDIWISYNYT